MRTLLMLCLTGLCGATVLADDVPSAAIVERLRESIQKDTALTAEVREQALRKLADSSQPISSLSAALAMISLDYAAGLQALSDEDFAAARAKFEALIESSNPVLSAEARFLAARADIAGERHEEALALLVDLLDQHGDDTARQAEAWFLRGQAAAAVLNRSQARRALKRFLRNYPDASARDRQRAETLLADMEEAEFDLLTDIHAKMDYSRRKLRLTDTGEQTREVQEDVVALLTELIEELEKKCGDCKGCKSCNGGKPGGSGQGGSSPGNSSGTSQSARITERAGPRTPWLDLSQRVDDPEAFNGAKEQLPLQYKGLIEQYYRSFQHPDEDAGK